VGALFTTSLAAQWLLGQGYSDGGVTICNAGRGTGLKNARKKDTMMRGCKKLERKPISGKKDTNGQWVHRKDKNHIEI